MLAAPPAEIEEWLQRRRGLGQDRYDEIWNGEYHVAPSPHFAHGDVGGQLFVMLGPPARRAGLFATTSFNLGGRDDYRVPDAGYVRERHATVYVPTAAVVVEVISPDDETWAKFDFYFAHGVEELLIVDPRLRTVQWFSRCEDGFESRAASKLLDLSADQLDADLDWPPAD